jgi:hypothetical protein
VVFANRAQVLWVIRVSRYKLYGSREIVTGYKAGGVHWSSVAVQAKKEPEICHGARASWRAAARVRMYWPLLICQGAGAKQKP